MIRKYPAVVVVPHANGHNDGGQAIVEHLIQKYSPALIEGLLALTTNIAARIAYDAQNRRAETLILEAPYPHTSASICALAHIPPQAVTHVLVIADANVFGFDPTGSALAQVARENGATAIGLGNVWGFDPTSAYVTTVESLGNKTRGLINYVEQHLRLPVPFIATGAYTVIDREPFPIHEEHDPTTVVGYGSHAVGSPETNERQSDD